MEKEIKKPVKILFVCLGNICRSPAAEGVFKHMLRQRGITDRFNIDSAGTYGGHAGELPDPRMRSHAARRGYLLEHRVTDYCRHYPVDCIPDPYYGGADGFENVLNILEDACEGIIEDFYIA